MTKPITAAILPTLLLFAFACAAESGGAKPSQGAAVLPVALVNWDQLNPARGDSSPLAGTLWGNRTANVATGFLVKFVDGFSSPPHIHNVSYRGLVIQGSIHNDHPSASKLWMPPGSFWTQPAGQVHITAARGSVNVAYIEIDRGPYLVRPTSQAFKTGEKAINTLAARLIWSTLSTSPRVHTARLWGNASSDNGTMLKLPAGSRVRLRSSSAHLRGIVIRGSIAHSTGGKSKDTQLEPGSYFSSKGTAEHRLAVSAQRDATLYLRTHGRFDVRVE